MSQSKYFVFVSNFLGVAKEYDVCQFIGQDVVGGSDVACFRSFGKHDAAAVGLCAFGQSFKQFHFGGALVVCIDIVRVSGRYSVENSATLKIHCKFTKFPWKRSSISQKYQNLPGLSPHMDFATSNYIMATAS